MIGQQEGQKGCNKSGGCTGIRREARELEAQGTVRKDVKRQGPIMAEGGTNWANTDVIIYQVQVARATVTVKMSKEM